MNPTRCLVPVSGGKDSQASLKLATEYFDRAEILMLFCDTGFEHPMTYGHVLWMEDHYGVRLESVKAGDVLEKSRKYGRFPGGGARHCTDELKIQPTKRFCKSLAERQGSGFEVWYGMRSGESPERARRYAEKKPGELYPPHEVMPGKYPKYLAALGVAFRLCILDWSEPEVIEFVGAGNLNPLYGAGFSRVGCFPCLAGGDKAKRKAFDYDNFGRAQLTRVQQVAQEIGKPVYTSKSHAHLNTGPGCMVCEI